MSDPGFRYVEDGPVARFTIDRPEAMNALTFASYRGLTDGFRALAEKPHLRVATITGTGRAFCTGGDVKEIIGPLLGRTPEQLLEFTQMTCDLIRAIRSAPQPVVACLNGPVAGAGAAIAVACDLRIAAAIAKIAFLFVKVGLAGADMGMAYLLPRLIGHGRATELLMTGAFTDAAEAQRIGLYNRVVAPEQHAAECETLVQALADGPARALTATKRALEREMHVTLAEALDDEARIQAELMAEPDFREGFTAFVEKRRLRFAGAPDRG